MILPLRMVSSPWQNAFYRISPRMTPYTVNFAAVTLSKLITRTLLTLWKVDWSQNKLLSNWNYQSHSLLGTRTISNCNEKESRNEWALPKIFCAAMTLKMLFSFRRQRKNDYFLPPGRYRYVKASLNMNKHGPHLSTQIHKCKHLSLHESR